MKSFFSYVVKFLLILVLVSLWGFYGAIRPFKITSQLTPQQFGFAYENIFFKTQDGLLLKGWFIPNANPKAKTIILLHGYPADKGDILPVTIQLAKVYNLLYFDFRHLGESDGFYSSIGKNEINDLLAAIQYLHSRHINEVGVWGFSMGAAVALMAAPQAREIKAIASISSFARLDWIAYEYYKIPVLKYPLGELTRLWAWLFLGYDIKDVSPAGAIKTLTIPILLVHSKNDRVITFDNALLLEKSLGTNSKVKSVFVTGLQHGELDKSLNQVIIDFFAKNL